MDGMIEGALIDVALKGSETLKIIAATLFPAKRKRDSVLIIKYFLLLFY